jgi:hypothetical protein
MYTGSFTFWLVVGIHRNRVARGSKCNDHRRASVTFCVDNTGNPDQTCAWGDIQGVDNRRAMRLAMDPHNQPKCKRQYQQQHVLRLWQQSPGEHSLHASRGAEDLSTMVNREAAALVQGHHHSKPVPLLSRGTCTVCCTGILTGLLADKGNPATPPCVKNHT